MSELLDQTLLELTHSLRAKKASPVELMQATLARVDATNRDLNAVVAMHDRDELLAAARVAEQRIQHGEARPLEGIPLGVKDLEDSRGLVNSEGSLIHKNRVSQHDTTQVERLRAAGAIVLGKTNAPEFGATAITKNLVYGVTRSPWNLNHTPGGSSGGSAAAIASCMLPLVTASDGGGSIRIPASFTGTFGLKVSFGRIPRGPFAQWEYQDTSVSGPLTKTVEDGAFFLDQVVGPSPHDPNSLPHPGLSYLESTQQPIGRKLRIGYSPDLGYAIVQSDIAAAVEENVKVFEKLGHHVEQIPSGPPVMGREWAILGIFELASHIYPYLPERESEFGRSLLAGVKMAWEVTPEAWGKSAQARARLNQWCAEVFTDYDLLITPTVPYDPPPAGGPFPEETEGRKQILAGVAAFTIPFNLSWNPAATVRVGLSRNQLPMGMQIVGPRHRDDLVLQAARAFEQERPWHPHWAKEW